MSVALSSPRTRSIQTLGGQRHVDASKHGSCLCLCTLAAAAALGTPFSVASRPDAQERARPPKNIGQQQREDSLEADKALKSGKLDTLNRPGVSRRLRYVSIASSA